MSGRRGLLRPTLRLAVAGAATVAAVRWVRAGRARLEPVAPELRALPLAVLPLDIPDVRRLRAARRVAAMTTKVRPGVRVSTRAVPGFEGDPDVGVLVYEPAGRDRSAPTGALVWIHGGGTILGKVEVGHDVCSHLAGELGILVVSVDYRLAPEHPFPAALHDCFAALAWLHDTAEHLGVDPDRIAVGGDSAGGLLAASLAQCARDRGGPPIRFQLLQYPMLDDRTVVRAERDGVRSLLWTPVSNRFAWTAYLGREPGAPEPRRWAVPGRCTDLAGLPPAWIGVGDADLFYEEDLAYAEALREAGVACELHVEPGMYHGADNVKAAVPSMRAFRQRMVDALAAALTAPP